MPRFLVEGQYGKTKVRVVRVVRHTKSYHDMTEVDVECLLEGKLETSYTIGDNGVVVPTDTIKNTIYAFAEKTKFQSIENLGMALCEHFISRHRHISRVSISMVEHLWRRTEVDGQPHDHVFSSETDTRTAQIIGTRRGANMIDFDVVAGLDDLKVLKTTQSGFEEYIVDEHTTLKPCTDRFFCTIVKAEWRFDVTRLPKNFLPVNQNIKSTLLKVFGGPPKGGLYSKSVQETMYQMAVEVLKTNPAVTSISLTLPNIHHFQFDLERFGLPQGNIFYPTSDPSGLIKCKVSRDDAKLPLLSRL